MPKPSAYASKFKIQVKKNSTGVFQDILPWVLSENAMKKQSLGDDFSSKGAYG